MEVDVLFVGGGMACLSGALHLANLIRDHNEKVEQGAEGHGVQVHGLDEVGQEGALDAEDVPPGELV